MTMNFYKLPSPLAITIHQSDATATIQFHDLNSNPGLLATKTRDIYIQDGTYKITHIIDTHSLKLTILNIKNFSQRTANNNVKFSKLINQKVSELEHSLTDLEVKPISKRNKRSIDWIGSGIKWAFGNPDAIDLKLIKEALETNILDINSLITGHNQQIIINNQFERRLNEITSVTNTILLKLQMSDNNDAIKLIFHLDIIQKHLDTIIEALTLANLGLVSRNLLTNQETDVIAELMTNQTINLRNIDAALDYCTPLIDTDEKRILYIIKVPHLKPEIFQELRIQTFPKNGSIIKTDFTSVITSQNFTMTSNNRCTYAEANKICNTNDLTDISEDTCIPQLIRNQKAKCNHTKVASRKTVNLIEPGMMIVNPIDKLEIQNDCGAANQSVRSPMLIVYEGCTIIVNDAKFINTNINLLPTPVLLPFTDDLLDERKISPDIDTLHDLHIKNLEKIDHMSNNRITFHLLTITNLVITVVIITVIIVYARRNKTYKVDKDIPQIEMKEVKPVGNYLFGLGTIPT
jgi:hypothetical protein